MNIKELFENNMPTDFSDNSKAWIYQSSRPFGKEEVVQIQEQLDQFVMQWKSHGNEVKGWGKIVFDNFIILIADDDIAHVGGCSTDAMVRIIKSFERQYNVNLFDRLSLIFYSKDKFERLPLNQLQYAIDKKFIDEHTLYFDSSVADFQSLKHRWIVELKDSWLRNRIVV